MYRTLTALALLLLLLTASPAFAWTDADGGQFGSMCGGLCQSPDGGMYSRNSTTGNYNYTPPSYQPTQPAYNGAFRSNPYDNGNGAPGSRRDALEEIRQYQLEPRNALGQPRGGYQF